MSNLGHSFSVWQTNAVLCIINASLIQWASMFGKVKNFAVKKLLESQLKNVPADQRDMIMNMVEKDPSLFEKIAKELQAEMKINGNNQMNAAMKVLPRYQKEIMATMTPEMKEKMIAQQLGTQGKFNPNGSIRR
jgi:hypothetical protein